MSIKVNIEKGNLLELRGSGTTAELGAELLGIIFAVYDNLDDDAQKEFKQNMLELLPLCFASEEEKMKFFEEKAEEAEETEKNIEDLIDSLQELRDVLVELQGKNTEKKDETVCNKA